MAGVPLSKQGIKTKRYPQRKMILKSLGHVKEWKNPLDILLDTWQKQQIISFNKQ
jgi:hypothetical protein